MIPILKKNKQTQKEEIEGVKWMTDVTVDRIEINLKDILGKRFNMKSDVGESNYTIIKNALGEKKALVIQTTLV